MLHSQAGNGIIETGNGIGSIHLYLVIEAERIKLLMLSRPLVHPSCAELRAHECHICGRAFGQPERNKFDKRPGSKSRHL